MYASRAKKIKNNCNINLDISGKNSNINQINLEIKLLNEKLIARNFEFDNLKKTTSLDQKENEKLNKRLLELQKMNENEKKEMDFKVRNIIHNSSSELAISRSNVIKLQSKLSHELEVWQIKCKNQELEIASLKNVVEALENIRQQKDGKEGMCV